MADLVVIVGVIAFFAICVWFVRACDRIIGPDFELDVPASEPPEHGQVAA
jgi:hypothetical protein